MRALFFVFPVVLLMAVLAACTTTAADDTDDAVADDPTETPVMEEQVDDADDAVVDDAEDDAVDDAAPDDAVTDDDDVDDVTDDEAVDDVTDDEVVDDAVTEDDEEAAEPTEHIIEINDGNEFSPAEITIAPGDTVTWVNNTEQVHTSSADPEIANDPANVQLPEGAESWHSGNIEPGEEYSITLDVPGEYVYFCYPHQDAGMLGTIIVEDDAAETDDTAPVDDEADDVDVVDDADDVEYDDVEPEVDTDDDDAEPVTEEPTTYNGKDATN